MANVCQNVLGLVLFFLCAWSVSNSSVPVVRSVHLSMENQMRHITLRYEAQEKPVIFWRITEFISHLDNTTNSFTGSQGEATLHMYVNPREPFEVNYTIRALIYADNYQISLDIKKGNVRLSESEDNIISPIMLKALPNGIIEYDDGETVNIELSVESEDLGSFEMLNSWSTLSDFDYGSYPSAIVGRRSRPWRENTLRFYSQNAFIMPKLNISGTDSTVERTTAEVNTSHSYTEGEVEFGVRLGFNSQHNLLDQIRLRSWVYLKERSHEGPFRNTVNFIGSSDNNKRDDIVSDRWLYTEANAMGYPKPDIKLSRDCAELMEPEVEICTWGTSCRTYQLIRFRNASDSLTGTYYFSAASGDEEITKMIYIQKI